MDRQRGRQMGWQMDRQRGWQMVRRIGRRLYRQASAVAQTAWYAWSQCAYATRCALLVWGATRALYVLASVLIASIRVPGWLPVAAGTPRVVILLAHTPNDVLYRWWFWDASFYVSIAGAGYYAPEKTAWFPLFPLLIAAVQRLTGLDALLVALLIGNGAALAAFVALSALCERLLGRRAVPGVLLLVSAYPLAFFLAAAYTDALALALMLWALVWGLRRRWALAILAAFLAGLARPTAPILIAPLVVIFLSQQTRWVIQEHRSVHRVTRLTPRRATRHRFAASARARRGTRRVTRRVSVRGPVTVQSAGTVIALVGILGAVPLAWALYALYCAHQFGQPLLFLTVQRGPFYNHLLLWPWQSLGMAWGDLRAAPLGSYAQLRVLPDLLPVLAALAGTLLALVSPALATLARLTSAGRVGLRRVGLRRVGLRTTQPYLPWYWLLWLLGTLVQVLCIGTLHTTPPDIYVSAGRYLLLAVPLPLLLMSLLLRQPPRVARLLLALLLILGVSVQIVLLAFELNHGWLV